MLLCRVVGRAVATHSHSSLDGFSMLLCQQEDSAGVPTGEPPFVAIDLFGAGMHQRVFVSTAYATCYDSCGVTCEQAADKYNGTLPMAEAVGGGWGMPLSLLCDIFISMGLALQKGGHNRLKRKEEGTIFQQWPWVFGLLFMMAGEVGNLVAYGDRGTPTAVITAVGCIGAWPLITIFSP